MSAIAGLCQPAGKRAERADIAAMLDRMARCGPDESGIWCQGETGLGHRMLRTTPESLDEHLPLFNSAASLAITCDARIDNRSELIHACRLAGPDQAIPDSELILGAYRHWGEACPEKLLGDFSFAIWDGANRRLFCARDHLGIKPFFYWHAGEFFAFASEIKALFSLPQIPRRLNQTRIGQHLLGFFEDRTITFFEGVSRLAPGHQLTLRPDGLTIREYWRASPQAEIRRSSDAEYAEEYRALFTQAVRCRLRSAGGVGSLLSGGLDSSSIACVARNQLRADGRGALHTFSALFREGSESDERSYIDSILRGGGFIPHFFDGDTVSPVADFDAVLGELDEVMHGADLTQMRIFFAEASRQGVRVLLDGLGGDEMVSHGARHLRELLRDGEYGDFARQATGLARGANRDRSLLVSEYVQPYLLELKRRRKWGSLATALVKIPRQLNQSVPRFIGDYALRPMADKWKRRLRGPVDASVQAPASSSILSEDFVRSIGLDERELRARRAAPSTPGTGNEAHCHAINNARLWLAIEELTRASAGYGIESRYPQLDKRLVEYSLALPASQKLSQGWSRAIFRRAMQGVLPEEVCWRPGKAAFLSLFVTTLQTYGRELLDQTILHTPPAVAPYFNLPVLRMKYQRFLEGEASEAQHVWRASNLIWWLQSLEQPAGREGSDIGHPHAASVR